MTTLLFAALDFLKREIEVIDFDADRANVRVPDPQAFIRQLDLAHQALDCEVQAIVHQTGYVTLSIIPSPRRPL